MSYKLLNTQLTLKLAIISFFVLSPAFISLIFTFPRSTDFVFYSELLKGFSTQLWSGDIRPLWLMNVNANFGSPVFIFYAPLPFYIASIFEFLSDVDAHGFLRISLTIYLGIIACGLAFYSYLKLFMDKRIAEYGAVIYGTLPYIIYIIYYTFSISQIWTLVFIALLLKASHDMLLNGWKTIPALSLYYSLLALTHLPTVVTFGIVPIAYVVVFSEKSKRFKNSIFAIISAIIGVLLSAFYIFPLFFNKIYINITNFIDGKFSYNENLSSIDTYIFSLFFLVPLLIALILRPAKEKTHIRQSVFWSCLLGGVFFLTTKYSYFLWNGIGIFHFLQFPSRFFPIAIPAISFFLVSLNLNIRIYSFLSVILFVITIFSSINAFNNRSNDDTYKFVIENNIISPPASEYSTKWMLNYGLDSLAISKKFKELLSRKNIALEEGSGEVSLLSEKPRSITLHANIKSDTALVSLRRFYFTGWQVDSGASIQEYHSLLAVQLPKGEHDIKLELKWFEGEYEGLLVSCFGLFILLVITAFAYMFPRKMD